MRPMNPTYRNVKSQFAVALPAHSSTATMLRSHQPSKQMVAVPVRGAATQRAPGRWIGGFNRAVQLCAGYRVFRCIAEQQVLPADHDTLA